MEFDLSQYEVAETATLEVQNKKNDGPLLGGDGQPVTIELYGPGSEAYVKVQAEIERAAQDRMVRAMQKGGKSDAFVDSRVTLAKRLTACTKSVSPNFPVDPKSLWSNPRLGYITKQAAEMLDDWANF